MKKHVVKRRGFNEHYDEKKVYGSCYAAALNCHYGEKKSEEIASKVTKKVTLWIKGKSFVTSDEIRDQIVNVLSDIDKDVAIMYKHHLDLS